MAIYSCNPSYGVVGKPVIITDRGVINLCKCCNLLPLYLVDKLFNSLDICESDPLPDPDTITTSSCTVPGTVVLLPVTMI